jgi:hypothetical protein
VLVLVLVLVLSEAVIVFAMDARIASIDSSTSTVASD